MPPVVLYVIEVPLSLKKCSPFGTNGFSPCSATPPNNSASATTEAAMSRRGENTRGSVKDIASLSFPEGRVRQLVSEWPAPYHGERVRVTDQNCYCQRGEGEQCSETVTAPM